MSSAKTGGRDDWQTPDVVLERVRRLGPIGLDPASTIYNPTGAARTFTKEEDGLTRHWAGHGLVYVNPPYSEMKVWADKIAREAASVQLVALVAARSDTRWWRRMLESYPIVAFWRGRLKFKGAPSPAPFPSALFFYNIHSRTVLRTVGDVCDVFEAVL